MKLLSALLLAFFLCTTPALAWEAQVLAVPDGDSIKVTRLDTGEKTTVRLYGIDAPEYAGRDRLTGKEWPVQPWNLKARDFLAKLLGETKDPNGNPTYSKVTIEEKGYDKYTRTVTGVVFLPNGKKVQEELLKAGLVWVNTDTCTTCRDWEILQQVSRQSGEGFWQSHPVAPWEWRSGKRK